MIPKHMFEDSFSLIQVFGIMISFFSLGVFSTTFNLILLAPIAIGLGIVSYFSGAYHQGVSKK